MNAGTMKLAVAAFGLVIAAGSAQGAEDHKAKAPTKVGGHTAEHSSGSALTPHQHGVPSVFGGGSKQGGGVFGGRSRQDDSHGSRGDSGQIDARDSPQSGGGNNVGQIIGGVLGGILGGIR